MELFVNMLAGAATLLVTKPLEGGIAAWLTTTFLIFVVLPGIAGVFLGKDWASPAFHWWGKWFVRAPFVVFLAIVLYLVHYPARAIEGAANRRWTAERPLGHILAVGGNFAAGCFYWPARLLAELTGLGIANLPRGARAAAPAAHH